MIKNLLLIKTYKKGTVPVQQGKTSADACINITGLAWRWTNNHPGVTGACAYNSGDSSRAVFSITSLYQGR